MTSLRLLAVFVVLGQAVATADDFIQPDTREAAELRKKIHQAANSVAKIPSVRTGKQREDWVKGVMAAVRKATDNKYNVVVFYTGARKGGALVGKGQPFTFKRPKDGTAIAFEMDAIPPKAPGNLTFTVFVFNKSTEFINRGDGGYDNWAFYGYGIQRNKGNLFFRDAPGK